MVRSALPRPTMSRRVAFTVAALVSTAIALAPTVNTVELNRDDRPWLTRTSDDPDDE
jgi:hypothetical protein